eukprot:scaffold31988_cov67-Phaeocystis_antarctica.AAC.1
MQGKYARLGPAVLFVLWVQWVDACGGRVKPKRRRVWLGLGVAVDENRNAKVIVVDHLRRDLQVVERESRHCEGRQLERDEFRRFREVLQHFRLLLQLPKGATLPSGSLRCEPWVAVPAILVRILLKSVRVLLAKLSLTQDRVQRLAGAEHVPRDRIRHVETRTFTVRNTLFAQAADSAIWTLESAKLEQVRGRRAFGTVVPCRTRGSIPLAALCARVAEAARRARAHGAVAPLGSTDWGGGIVIFPLDPTASVQTITDVIIWPLHLPRDLCTRYLRGLVCSARFVDIFSFEIAPVTLRT